MLSALIPSARGYPAARLASRPANQRRVRHGPLVLVPAPLKPPTPATDRDRTVSRRSEPSSRATLIGEQPNPWDLLRASPTRRSRCQAPFCHCTRQAVTNRLEGTLGSLRYPFGGDHPSQTTRHAVSPQKTGVRSQTREGPYFNAGSPSPGEGGSMPPAYPTRPVPGNNAKLQ